MGPKLEKKGPKLEKEGPEHEKVVPNLKKSEVYILKIRVIFSCDQIFPRVFFP